MFWGSTGSSFLRFCCSFVFSRFSWLRRARVFLNNLPFLLSFHVFLELSRCSPRAGQAGGARQTPDRAPGPWGDERKFLNRYFTKCIYENRRLEVESNREMVSVRFVRACVRAVWLRSGIRLQKCAPHFSLFCFAPPSFPCPPPPNLLSNFSWAYRYSDILNLGINRRYPAGGWAIQWVSDRSSN